MDFISFLDQRKERGDIKRKREECKKRAQEKNISGFPGKNFF